MFILLCIDMFQISQKLMVQGYSGHARYKGGIDVARKVIKADGIRGLYRGFGLSVMTYAPSSAVWWASYGSSQRIIWRLTYLIGSLLFSSQPCALCNVYEKKTSNTFLLNSYLNWYFPSVQNLFQTPPLDAQTAVIFAILFPMLVLPCQFVYFF